MYNYFRLIRVKKGKHWLSLPQGNIRQAQNICTKLILEHCC